MADLKVAIAGAGGRMGAAIIRAASTTGGMVVQSAFDRIGSSAIGKDAGALAGIEPYGVTVLDHVEAALAGAQAIIDFTAPAASVALARKAAERGLVHIIGTTGCSAEDDAAIKAAARAGARIVKSGNYSLGINVLAGLVRQAAAALPRLRHRDRRDAPQQEGRCALGHGADAGRGGGRGPRRRPWHPFGARPRRPYRRPRSRAPSALPRCAAAPSSATTR